MDLDMESSRWFEEAEYDLDTAAGNLKIGRFNWACFISQQAAEKAVKAIHIRNGDEVERVHSISSLIKGDMKRSLAGIDQLSRLLASAMELDRHYVPTRYPNGVPYGKPFEFYDEQTARKCVDCARKLIEACREILQSI